MKVWIVSEETGAYSQRDWSIEAAFTSLELAERYCAARRATPGFSAESGPGDESGFEIHELEVWNTPAEKHVLTWNIYNSIHRGAARYPHPYRVVEVVRDGYEAELWGATLTPSDHPRSEGWADIRVRAETQERAIEEHARLAREWTGREPFTLSVTKFLSLDPALDKPVTKA